MLDGRCRLNSGTCIEATATGWFGVSQWLVVVEYGGDQGVSLRGGAVARRSGREGGAYTACLSGGTRSVVAVVGQRLNSINPGPGRTCTTSLKYLLCSTTLGQSKPRPRSQSAFNIHCRLPSWFAPLGEPKASCTRLQTSLASVKRPKQAARDTGVAPLLETTSAAPLLRAEVRLHPACGERRQRRQQQWPSSSSLGKTQDMVQSNIWQSYLSSSM